MKNFMIALALGVCSAAFAQDITLPEFGNWVMPDIAAQGLKKEDLFSKMNNDMIKSNDSVCANRALVWAYDFKRFNNVDAGKTFLFYTQKTGDVGATTWWYHVTPTVNEKGTIYAMDAGFSYTIKKPLELKGWFKRFTGSETCQEIKATDTDLIERMFLGYVFPSVNSHGKADCYYINTPGGYWTPISVAMALLGKDRNGQPIHFVRDEIVQNEVYTACVEAVTSSLGRVLGGGRMKCKKYLGMND